MKPQKLLKNCLMADLFSTLIRAVRVVCFVLFSALEKPFSIPLSSRKTTLHYQSNYVMLMWFRIPIKDSLIDNLSIID